MSKVGNFFSGKLSIRLAKCKRSCKVLYVQDGFSGLDQFACLVRPPWHLKKNALVFLTVLNTTILLPKKVIKLFGF